MVCCATWQSDGIRAWRCTSIQCDFQERVSLHTSYQVKAGSCEADFSSANKDRGHVLNAGNIVSTAARHTSVTKVADKAVRQVLGRRGLIGAAASSDPFHVFIVFVGATVVGGFSKTKSTQT